uniref:ZP domain-containing protein n=1 Tax=Plectus sambesii TaxID=2011161 RepID=A0A914W4Y0_9BILA
MFGILINNCYVTDGFGKRADVVDSRGCPVDPILITGIRYSQDLQRAYAESHVFKFADKPGVWFFCQIQMCMKGPGMCNGITPPSCAAAEVDGGHGHEAGPPMIATLPLPGPTFTGNGGNTGTTGASYGVSGYGGSTGYGGGVTGGFTQPRAQGPGPGFGLSNAPLQQPFTAFGPALPPDQHSESTVGNTHGGTFGVLGNKKEVTAIYETRDLPYQSSAAIAKGSTRASTYQFDTPSVTFEKTSYVPSSPASFIPTSPEEEEGAEEGEGPVSGATDEEMEADGDGHDVTLPSDLSDLLGQLPEGEVDMEGVEEIFRDSVDDRRALLDKFGKLLNKMKKKAHAPPPKKKQMGRGSSAKAAMPGDRLDSMQVSWESSGPKFAKMAADAPPPAAPNDDSVKDGPPEIAGQLIIFDLDEDPPSYMQLSRSHVDEDENGTLSSSFSSSDVLPDGTPLSAPCVISRNGLTTLATVLGGLAALFFFIACALCMRVCRTRKDNSMPDKSISYNLYDDRAPPPGMRKVSRSRSREHNGDREHRRHHSRR